jgi:hypothetical protein
MAALDVGRVAHLRVLKTDLAVGAMVAGATVVALDGGVGWLAQRAGQAYSAAQGIDSGYLYSLPLHVASMLAVSALAVMIAAVLNLAGHRLLAALVVLGAVAGPLTLVAAPISSTLIRTDSMDTVAGWHLFIGGLQLLILSTSTWWTSRCLMRRDFSARLDLADESISGAILYAAVGACCLAAQVPAMGNLSGERPMLVVATGWSLLIAGVTVVLASVPRWRPVLLVTIGCAVVVLLMGVAYLRPGGWPGVAGWEFNGMESPVILSWANVPLFLLSPSAGLAAALLFRAGRSARVRAEARFVTET